MAASAENTVFTHSTPTPPPPLSREPQGVEAMGWDILASSHPLISSQNFPLAQPGKGAQEKQFAGDEQLHLKANEQCLTCLPMMHLQRDLLGKAKKCLASSPGLWI